MSTIITDPVTPSAAGGDDDDTLVSVFLRSRETLRFFIEHAEQLYPSPLADSTSLEVTRRAWLEVEPLFDDLIAPVRWQEEQRNALRMEGLSGDQLRFKAAVFDYLYAQFVESRHQLLQSQAPRRRRPFSALWQKEEGSGVFSAAFGWARNMLGYINTILESAKAAFPPIGAIKEFKEAQEVLLESKRLVEEQSR